jgi:2-polyprenyl-3-methyl-5-hydroxy-6-metoxy-1,4-benzoquinol methylase
MTFLYIDPPFNFNAPNVAKCPAEVTGNYLLKCMAERLGWRNFENRSLYDFGCGVSFARAIANLNLDFDRYVGIDVNAEAIRWLREHLPEPKFRFAHFDAQNSMYHAGGKPIDEHIALPFAAERFDAVCMFSVITHQAPSDAVNIFSLIRRSIVTHHLYFTAFIDENVDGYVEADPANPLLRSTYNPALMRRLLGEAG